MERRDLLVLAGADGVGIWLNQLVFLYAIRLTTASSVAIVFGLLPIAVALVSQAAGLERLPSIP